MCSLREMTGLKMKDSDLVLYIYIFKLKYCTSLTNSDVTQKEIMFYLQKIEFLWVFVIW
jgi:hypothetical protein